MNGASLERLLFKHLGEPFVKSAMESVFLARQEAWTYCRERYDSPEAVNTVPWLVRANLEGLLRETAERHGLQSKVEQPEGQPWFHTEVSNGRVVLTAATVGTPGGMVQPSDYRRGLAWSGQGQLFPVEEDGRQIPDNRWYAILTHSRFRGNRDDLQKCRHLPGSVYVVWPARDCEYYVHTLNLMERYEDIVRKYVPREWNEQAVVKYIKQARKSAFSA